MWGAVTADQGDCYDSTRLFALTCLVGDHAYEIRVDLEGSANAEGACCFSTIGISTVDTVAGVLVGTPQYMSPDQLRGEAASAARDI